MASTCPDCGEESLMFGNLGDFFPVSPYCANDKCKSYGEFK